MKSHLKVFVVILLGCILMAAAACAHESTVPDVYTTGWRNAYAAGEKIGIRLNMNDSELDADIYCAIYRKNGNEWTAVGEPSVLFDCTAGTRPEYLPGSDSLNAGRYCFTVSWAEEAPIDEDVSHVEDFIVAADQLPVPEVTITAGGTGRDAQVTVKADDNAGYVYFQFEDGFADFGGAGFLDFLRPSGGWGEGVTKTIQGYAMTEPGTYTASATAYEFMPGSGEAIPAYADSETVISEFTLEEPGLEMPYFWLGYEFEPGYAYSDSIPNADAVHVYGSVISPDGEYLDEEGYYVWNTSTEPGSVMIEVPEDIPVPACYDISITARINGQWAVAETRRSYVRVPLPAPVIQIPESVTAGEELIAYVSQMDNVYQYDISVETYADGQFSRTCVPNKNGSVVLAPTGLDAGEYEIWVYAESGSGFYSSNSKRYTLSVTGSRPAVEPVITVPTDGVEAGNTIWITVEAEGLEAVMEGSSLYAVDNGKVHMPTYVYYYDDDNTHEIFARINGRWAGPFTAYVQKTDPSGFDEHLDVTWAATSINRGDSLPFTVTLWDEAEYYSYSVSYIISEDEDDTEREQIVYELEFQPDAQGNWTIPGCYFTKPGKWDVGINAYNSGEYCKTAQAYITVSAPANPPAAPAVRQITENPQMNGDVSFEITTGGAEKVCIVLKEEWSENYVFSNPIYVNTNGQDPYVYTFNKRDYDSWDWADTYFLMASVCNNNAWSEYSSSLSFTMAYDSDVEFPRGEGTREVWINEENLKPGDPVILHWVQADGAERYLVSVEGRPELTRDLPATITSCTFDTTGWQPGSYEFRVKAYAVGKRSDQSSTWLQLRNNAWKPTLSTAKNVYRTGETVRIEIGSSGGDMITITVNGKNDYTRIRRESSGSQTVILPLSTAGRYVITAEACTSDEEIDSTISNSLTVNVADLIFPADLETIESEAFSNVKNVVVYVPSDATIAEDAFDATVTILTD